MTGVGTGQENGGALNAAFETEANGNGTLTGIFIN